MKPTWNQLQQQIIHCDRCPRLRTHCTQVAAEKRLAFRSWDYWGKPVPNLGQPTARLLILGLAPAAHGANRTGRMFTGDRSGDFLFQALYDVGLANQPTSRSNDDGLQLIHVAITATAHCAPPANKPTPEETANCAPFLDSAVDAMPDLRGILVLGRIAFDAALALYRRRGWIPRPLKPKPTFSHGQLHTFPGTGVPPVAKPPPFLLCSFHPSQQNTFTGRLTPTMMRQVLQTAAELIR